MSDSWERDYELQRERRAQRVYEVWPRDEWKRYCDAQEYGVDPYEEPLPPEEELTDGCYRYPLGPVFRPWLLALPASGQGSDEPFDADDVPF